MGFFLERNVFNLFIIMNSNSRTLYIVNLYVVIYIKHTPQLFVSCSYDHFCNVLIQREIVFSPRVKGVHFALVAWHSNKIIIIQKRGAGDMVW